MKKKEDERNMKEFLFYAEAFIQQGQHYVDQNQEKIKRLKEGLKTLFSMLRLLKKRKTLTFPKEEKE